VALSVWSANLAAQPITPSHTPAEVIELRLGAEQLERDHKYAACAHAYLQAYESNPTGRGAEEVLYNAGVCYEYATLVSRAIETYRLFETRFPSSPLIRKTLIRRASASASIARFSEAAEAYERFAKVLPGEKGAPDALSNAILYRRAIGDTRAALRNSHRFLRNYLKRMPRESGAVFLDMANLYKREGDATMEIETYKAFLKSLGVRGGPGRVLLAHARLGELYWNMSCPVKVVDGLCVKIDRKLKRSSNCAAASTTRMRVLPRNKKVTTLATTHFRKALALARRAQATDPSGDEGQEVARYWVGSAQMYLADAAFEKFIDQSMHTSQRISAAPREEWMQSLLQRSEWLRAQSKDVILAYEKVRSFRGEAQWSIAAATRVGQVLAQNSAILQTTTSPTSTAGGGGASKDAYCSAVSKDVAELENLATDAFHFCLNLSTATNRFNSWSQVCEERLAALHPTSFPRPKERHAMVRVMAYRAARAPLLLQAPR